MKPGVQIIVPTLGRAQALAPLAENIAFVTPEGMFDLTFVVDQEDFDSYEAVAELDAWVVVSDGTYPQKTNAGYGVCDRYWVLPTADDVVFHPHWLEHALQFTGLTNDTKNLLVIGTNDLSPMSSDTHSTMPLISRRYIETKGCAWNDPGVVFHEGYHHNFVETEVCELAQHRGCWAWMPGSIIEHRHPSWGTRQIDDTDRKGWMVGMEADQALMEQRRKEWTSA